MADPAIHTPTFSSTNTTATYSGQDIIVNGEVVAKSGDNIDNVVSSLAAAIPSAATLANKTSEVQYDGKQSLIGGSVDTGALSKAAINWTMINTVTHGVFNYDASSINAYIPSGYSLSSFSIKASNDRVLQSAKTQSGSLSIPVSSFPVNIEVSVRLSGINGEITMSSYKFFASNAIGIGSSLFTVKSVGGGEEAGGINSILDTSLANSSNSAARLKAYDEFTMTVDGEKSSGGVMGAMSLLAGKIESMATTSTSAENVSLAQISGCNTKQLGTVQDAVDALAANQAKLIDAGNSTT